MKVLITGSDGFIGSNLYLALKKDKSFTEITRVTRNVYIKQEKDMYTCDLSNWFAVKEMMENLGKFDIIFHLAGNPKTRIDEENPTAHIDNNITSTFNLCHYAKECPLFILASSIVVYGETLNDSITGYPIDEATPCAPISTYAISKLAAENIAGVYHNQKRINCRILRMCATVGPNLTHGIIYDFINKLKSDNPYLEVLGKKPGSIKPYMHIDDVVSAFIAISTKKLRKNICYDDTIFNLSTNPPLSVAKVAEVVMNTIGIKKPIKWLGAKANWAGDNPLIHIDASRFNNYYKLRPRYDSFDAITTVVESYQ